MSKQPVWGAGAWAAEAELAEQEQKEREQAAYKAPGKVEAFPSLGDSLSSKPSKKKNKGQTFSLSELTVGKYVGPGGKSHKSYTDSQKLTTEELLSLPTGPREHRDEPEIGGLGGGFKDYGGFRANSDNNSRDDNSSRRGGFGGGFGGGFAGDRDDSSRGGGGFGRDRERDRDDGPSRADSEDKWGASKKFVPTPASDSRGGGGGGGGYDDDRRGGSRLSDRDLPSRADEVDNWGSTKKFVPTAPSSLAGGDGYNERRLSSGGRYEERRHSLGGGGGYEEHGSGGGVISRADEVDNWVKGKKFVPSTTPHSRVGGMGGGGGGGGLDSAYKEAGSDADRWARRDPLPRVTEQPRATERPRLNLAKRTVPVEGGVTVPAPAATAASETNGEKHLPPVGDLTLTDDQQQQTPVVKPKPRSNPFGAARPREEILAEKGQDYRKIDADLEVHKERYGRPGSRPSSSHSSRQGGGVTSRPQTPGGVSSRPHTPDVGTRSRPNPFGEAKPRDVVSIEEKGKDWRRLNVDLERRLAEESANAQAEPEENAAAVKENSEGIREI